MIGVVYKDKIIDFNNTITNGCYTLELKTFYETQSRQPNATNKYSNINIVNCQLIKKCLNRYYN